MHNLYSEFCVRAHLLLRSLKDDNGQDLVEYALVLVVVCLGIIAGMQTLANGINNAMVTLSNTLNTGVA